MTHGGEVHSRSIEHPWLLSLLAALVAALLAAFVLPVEGESLGYASGSHFGTLLLPWLAGALAIRHRSWPSWLAVCGLVVVFMLVLLLVAGVSRAVVDARERDVSAPGAAPNGSPRTSPGESQATTDQALSVETPRRVGEWRRLDGAEQQRVRRQALASLEVYPDDWVVGEPAVASYSHPTGQAVLVAIATGGGLAEEFAADERQGAVNFVGGALPERNPKSVDPGPLGGGAACVDDVDVLDGGLMCGWVGDGTAGQLLLQVPGMTIEEALPVLHLFHEEALADVG
ncbi:hypothetical protein ASG76_16820 [Nocardioides sp. Soil774]|uniref:hypothetical protein n=1 Tax=Nocardioides sp. Soil774 TaxID=1736408 RepID=UPI0006F91388|nr:hypothetical protein [Nocardioides sp. Soil774]KRE92623.1 hypothetical protein ASG76_16820 [Nocardioides sp. Soil774]